MDELFSSSLLWLKKLFVCYVILEEGTVLADLGVAGHVDDQSMRTGHANLCHLPQWHCLSLHLHTDSVQRRCTGKWTDDLCRVSVINCTWCEASDDGVCVLPLESVHCCHHSWAESLKVNHCFLLLPNTKPLHWREIFSTSSTITSP